MALVILWAELEAVASINTAIRLGNASETAEELMNPEAQLAIVYQTAANLYQNELFSLQLQAGRVRKAAYCGHLLSNRVGDHLGCHWEFFAIKYSIYFKFVQAGLSHEELSVAVEMLSAVAVLNEVLDTKDLQAVIEQLTDSPLGFSNMDQENLNRYTGWVLRSRWWI